jgi:hypothetical protein
MWHGQLVLQVSSQPSPRHAPSPRRVYTPSPDGFERFLRECLVLPGGGGDQSETLILMESGVPLVRASCRTLETSRMVEACGLTQAVW